MKHNPSTPESQYVYTQPLFPGVPAFRYLRTESGSLVFDGYGELPMASPSPSVGALKSTALTSLVIKEISHDFSVDDEAEKELTLEDYETKLQNCGKVLAKFEHTWKPQWIFVPITCKDRFCNRCAKDRAKKCRKVLTDYVFTRRGPEWDLTSPNLLSFVTLTCSNFPTEMLPKALSMFGKWLTRLKQRKIWKENFDGGVASYEVTKGRDGNWNLHLHILGHMSYIPQDALQKVWGKIVSREWTGYICDIRRVKSTLKSITEICKYPFKSGDNERKMSLEDRYVLSRAFHGRRMFAFLGSWYRDLRQIEMSMNDVYDVLVGNSELAEILKCCLYRGSVSLDELERSYEPGRWRYNPDLGAYIVGQGS